MDQSSLSYDTAQLATAVDLVNTYDPWYAEPESLGDVAALEQFLTRHGYAPEDNLNETDLITVLRLRDRLRAVFATDDVSVAVGVLAEAMAEVQVWVRLTVGADGSASIQLVSHPDDPPVTRLAADTAIGLSRALERHGIERLRECAARPCREAFVDTSRNGARRFCSHRCANRTNVAAFRERKRST